MVFSKLENTTVKLILNAKIEGNEAVSYEKSEYQILARIIDF